MSSRNILKRILDNHNLHKALEVLSQDLNGADLTSFLMEVFRRRTENVTPGHVMRQLSEDRFVMPSEVPQSVFSAFDQLAFALLPDWEHIELSPLAPLASSSAVAPVDARHVVNTTRLQDVMSDCSNVLAILAASKRRKNESTVVRLCTSQRLVRQQAYENPDFTAHFRVFCLVSAGRAMGNYALETNSLREHVSFYVNLLKSFSQTKDSPLLLHVREYRQTSADWSGISTDMEEMDIPFSHEQLEEDQRSYYLPFQFQIWVGEGNDAIPLIDGGCVDWTARLLSDSKERAFVSAIGTEVFCKLFLVSGNLRQSIAP